MTLAIDASSQLVCGGTGAVIEIRVHYYNNSDKAIDFSPSQSKVWLLNTTGTPIEQLQNDPVPGLCDNIHLPPRGSYDFDLSYHTNHDLTHSPHKLKVTVGDKTSHCLV